jgi:magnesium transporter
MAELYLSRKMAVSSSPSSSSDGPNWHHSPYQGSKIHRSSRGSAATLQGENDVEELEMLLEVIKFFISFCNT